MAEALQSSKQECSKAESQIAWHVQGLLDGGDTGPHQESKWHIDPSIHFPAMMPAKTNTFSSTHGSSTRTCISKHECSLAALWSSSSWLQKAAVHSQWALVEDVLGLLHHEWCLPKKSCGCVCPPRRLPLPRSLSPWDIWGQYLPSQWHAEPARSHPYWSAKVDGWPERPQRLRWPIGSTLSPDKADAPKNGSARHAQKWGCKLPKCKTCFFPQPLPFPALPNTTKNRLAPNPPNPPNPRPSFARFSSSERWLRRCNLPKRNPQRDLNFASHFFCLRRVMDAISKRNFCSQTCGAKLGIADKAWSTSCARDGATPCVRFCWPTQLHKERSTNQRIRANIWASVTRPACTGSSWSAAICAKGKRS